MENMTTKAGLKSARAIFQELGYAEWRNFHGVIKRAIALIDNGLESGKITPISKEVLIGFGAKRVIKDYLMDQNAFALIKALSSAYKLNKSFLIRNETALLGLLKKYCRCKGLDFQFQFHLGGYIFDCLINKRILIEYDEPHHKLSERQRLNDLKKDKLAAFHNYTLLRFGVHNDIIDAIVEVEKYL